MNIFFEESTYFKLGYVALFLLVLFSNSDGYHKRGDERANLSNLEVLKNHGLGREYLMEYYGLAGPAYPVIQYLALPLTRERINLMRSINVMFLGVIIYLLAILLKSDILPWMLMSVPMTYLCAGYAMTIVPSLVFLLLSFLILTKYNNGRHLFGKGLVAGVLLSLAILTRLNLLVLLPVWIVYLVWRGYHKNGNLSVAVGFLLGAIPLLATVFSVWEGVIPPIASQEMGSTIFELANKLSVERVLLTCGVAALIFILFNVDSLRIKDFQCNPTVIFIIALVLLLNYFVNLVNYLPAQVLWSHFQFNDSILYPIGSLIGSGVIVLAILLLRATILAWKNTWHFGERLAIISLVFIIMSSGITHEVFSTRYAYQAVPFIFITSGYSAGGKYIRMLGLIGGFVIYFAFRGYQGIPYISF